VTCCTDLALDAGRPVRIRIGTGGTRLAGRLTLRGGDRTCTGDEQRREHGESADAQPEQLDTVRRACRLDSPDAHTGHTPPYAPSWLTSSGSTSPSVDFPASQRIQVVLSALLYFPPTHTWQIGAVAAEKVPSPQLRHTLAPVPDTYCPARHWKHWLSPALA
jgi:hypothetical protein